MLTTNNSLLYLSGQSIPIKNCNIFLTPPTIRDIAMFGEEEFYMCVQVMGRLDTIKKELMEGNSELGPVSNFQILLEMLNSEENTKTLFLAFFKLIAPDYVVEINQQQIDFSIIDEESGRKNIVGRINPFTFDVFAEIIQDLFLPYSAKKEEYNPANDLAEIIAEKLKKGREKISQLKKQEEDGSLLGTFASILSIGMSVDINVIMEYTPFQLFDAITRYWSKTENDFYQHISTIPFMDASKIEAPKEWYRNLYQ